MPRNAETKANAVRAAKWECLRREIEFLRESLSELDAVNRRLQKRLEELVTERDQEMALLRRESGKLPRRWGPYTRRGDWYVLTPPKPDDGKQEGRQ